MVFIPEKDRERLTLMDAQIFAERYMGRLRQSGYFMGSDFARSDGGERFVAGKIFELLNKYRDVNVDDLKPKYDEDGILNSPVRKKEEKRVKMEVLPITKIVE